jgi:uncharacterized protein YcfL
VKHLLLILLSSILFVNCTTKRITKSSTEHIATSEVLQQSKEQVTSIEIRDTSIGIPTRSVFIEGLTKDQLTPLVNHAGQLIPQVTEKKANGASIKVMALANGTIDVNATCDSMTLTILGLRREITTLKEANIKTESTAVVTNTQESIIKSKPILAIVISGFSLLVAILIILVMSLISLMKVTSKF